MVTDSGATYVDDAMHLREFWSENCLFSLQTIFTCWLFDFLDNILIHFSTGSTQQSIGFLCSLPQTTVNVSFCLTRSFYPVRTITSKWIVLTSTKWCYRDDSTRRYRLVPTAWGYVQRRGWSFFYFSSNNRHSSGRASVRKSEDMPRLPRDRRVHGTV